ncbi:PREDICTED: L-type lectin-domain containing receptor kinase IX.1-like [Tarenaya hassleriana]|uniref:L-type lectin-domain containing receptor kinase IX.1-like n=1 Tax=Tarenaya hassleriana TaxID=28532 RepID=UPI00053C8116|nr:PREDICTED: L-type lectin-domain containing receptor kinase IX.1-like [Tarenaya hassleriana]
MAVYSLKYCISCSVAASAFNTMSTCFLFSFLLILPFVHSVQFNFSRFEPGNPDIAYQGDATPNDAIEFNNVDYTCRVGWATYARKVPLWDPATGQSSDFTTRFSFRIDTRNLSQYGHGFSFFLAPVGIQILPNSATGFLGLFNQTGVRSSLFPLVHIEFDTFYNSEWDPRGFQSHVGINNNSLFSANYTSWNASLHSQDIGHARISYNSAQRNLSVSWTYELTSDPRERTSLSYIIDLAKVLPSEVTIGFSAATGSSAEGHRLLSWDFSSPLDIQDAEKTPDRTAVIIGVSISGFVLLTFLVVTIVIILKRRQRKKKAGEATNLTSINEDLERGAGPRRFSYKDVASATNNFSDERKLGEGGFGAVYRGYFKDIDMMVAVKKFAGGSKQGRREFITEVKIISSLRHRNLVQLIGWCHEKDEFLLIYEFMPNNSLDSHLFGKRQHLVWAVRYKITLGIASALFYLHEEWEQCVVHRDIKASNIMLDSNFNVKLGDFGLARLMDHELGPQTTGLAGTFGYMAPEYISTGRASKESDVYSFGVVTLEIVTGRKSVDPKQGKIEPETSLVERVWDLYGRGELVSAIDEKLGDDFDKIQAECLMVVGLWCAHPDRSSRPSIKQAIQVLNFEAPLPKLPPKMPVATYHHVSSSSTTSVSSGGGTATFSSAQIGR